MDMPVGTCMGTQAQRHGGAAAVLSQGVRAAVVSWAHCPLQHPNLGVWVLRELQAQGSAGPHMLLLARRCPRGRVVGPSTAH